jgi:hypothetical protein
MMGAERNFTCLVWGVWSDREREGGGGGGGERERERENR